MSVTNIILLVVGGIVAIFGIAAFFIPSLAKWINAPGGPRLKAIISLVIGIIIIVISYVVPFPG